MRRTAILLLLVACRAPPASSTSSVVVTPVKAPPIASDAPPLEDTTSRFEMAMEYQEVCVRIEDRVFCQDGPADGRPLASGNPKLDDAIGIGLGNAFACAVRRSGKVSCWGANDAGQLGAGIADEKSDTPIDVKGVTNARRIVVGDRHACALLEGGAVACWGENALGATAGPVAYTEAARELVTPESVPRVVARSIAASKTASFAITRDGRVMTWGASPVDESPGESPRVVAGIENPEEITAAGDVMCALRLGEVACAGSSYSLFPGYRGRAEKPMAIATHGRVRRVRLADRHACALLVDGRIECWGSNSEGALGRKTANESSDTHEPGRVDDLPHALDVFAGGSMSCALTGRREVQCWGRWMSDGHERRERTPVVFRID